jgi:hypothetical protein
VRKLSDVETLKIFYKITYINNMNTCKKRALKLSENRIRDPIILIFNFYYYEKLFPKMDLHDSGDPCGIGRHKSRSCNLHNDCTRYNLLC